MPYQLGQESQYKSVSLVFLLLYLMMKNGKSAVIKRNKKMKKQAPKYRLMKIFHLRMVNFINIYSY